MSQPYSPTTKNRSRRTKAVLAGGAVLGIGTVVTLAAWTDDVWAGSTFSGGTFNIESSPTGAPGSFTEHETSDAALLLDFEVDVGNLSPSDAMAAPMVLRIDADSTYDASVALNSAAGAGNNATHLTYGIITVPTAADCTAVATGTTIVPAGTALGATTDAAPFDLVAGDNSDSDVPRVPGPPVTVCIQVTAEPTLLQGEDAAAQWQFTATSLD